MKRIASVVLVALSIAACSSGSSGGAGTGGDGGSGGSTQEPPLDCEATLGLAEGELEGTTFSAVSGSSYILGEQWPYSVASNLDNGSVWAWGESIKEPGDAHVLVQGQHYCATANWPATDLEVPRAILQLSEFSSLGSCEGLQATDTLEYCYARNQYYSGDGCAAEGDVKLWGTVNGEPIDQSYQHAKVSLAGVDIGDGLHFVQGAGFNFLRAKIGAQTRVFCVSSAEDDLDVIGGERTTFQVAELGTCGANPVAGELTACVLPKEETPFP